MPYLSTFGLEFEKAIVISEISTFEYLKKESLTHTVIFGIGCAFSKGPGSGFSEGPFPVWVRLIKHGVDLPFIYKFLL